MEPYLKELFSEYGPLALGWIVAVFLGWKLLSDYSASRAEAKAASAGFMDKYHEILEAYHEAVVENTKVTERLSLLIEERTRGRDQRNS